MREKTGRFPISAGLLLVLAICPKTASGAAKAELRLPEAVEKAPDWLKDSPFDVVKFFEMPPADQNAAPLYLEALVEFGPEMQSVDPTEARTRLDVISQRAKQARVVFAAWNKDQEHADRGPIDAILDEYKEGFRKLDLAQKRPRCVFATGLEYETLLPHAQVSRELVRVLLMRASRSLDRDDLTLAINDFERILRLSRDLRPRGCAITQVVSIACDSLVCLNGIPSILAHRKLKVEHCARLLNMIADYEAKAIDPFPEGIKGEYFVMRSLIRRFTQGIKTTVGPDGRLVENKLDRGQIVGELGLFFQQAYPKDDPLPEQRLGELADQFGREAAKVRNLASDFARLLIAAKPDYRERRRVINSVVGLDSKRGDLTLFRLVAPEVSEFLLSCARDQVYLRAAQCLIALRRWQLTHSTPPTDLAEVCRAAKLPGVPIDPFSGAPLKLATIEGEMLVYSIGPDGVDDAGLKDSDMGRKPEGDLLFRLPKRK